ncbi:MAG: DUF1854 domain-containing protein [Rhodocyclaceae bacterium]
MSATAVFRLQRNSQGLLECSLDEGATWTMITPVRAFPIAAPAEGISLLSADGRECVWIDRLDDLAPEVRAQVEEELASREFMPQIRRLIDVSTFATPSTWELDTDRGPAKLVLKGEEDIRRLGPQTLLIADIHGIQFLIRDLSALDRHSRKLLDRFL